MMSWGTNYIIFLLIACPPPSPNFNAGRLARGERRGECAGEEGRERSSRRVLAADVRTYHDDMYFSSSPPLPYCGRFMTAGSMSVILCQ